MARPVIAVFGATGAQGGGLVRALLASGERAFRVRAVTRQPGGAAARALSDLGAEICAADLDDAASVDRALAGAHGAFCATCWREHFRPGREPVRADTLAGCAARAGVRHLIWSTLDDTRRFVEAQPPFAGRGLPVTRLVTAFPWDDLIHFGLLVRHGADGRLDFVLPMGDAPLPGIAAADIGACAAALFHQGAAAVGRRIGIAGEHLSGAQMAAALSRALGEPVRPVAPAPAPDEHAARGVQGADELARLFRFMRDFNAECGALWDVRLTRALHPGLQDFSTWLAANAARLPIAAPMARQA